ncbi:MAG: hypothetical protein R2712_29465, partial [Vicinamibacterales bacterium]
MHTVIVVDTASQPIRVRCDYCGSEHNYRGGPRHARPAGAASSLERAGDGDAGASRQPAGPSRAADSPASVPAAGALVSPRERRFPPMSHDTDAHDLETLIRTVIREESGLTPVAP